MHELWWEGKPREDQRELWVERLISSHLAQWLQRAYSQSPNRSRSHSRCFKQEEFNTGDWFYKWWKNREAEQGMVR